MHPRKGISATCVGQNTEKLEFSEVAEVFPILTQIFTVNSKEVSLY